MMVCCENDKLLSKEKCYRCGKEFEKDKLMHLHKHTILCENCFLYLKNIPKDLTYSDFQVCFKIMFCLNCGYYPTHHSVYICVLDNQPYEAFTKEIRCEGCNNSNSIDDFDNVPNPFKRITYEEFLEYSKQVNLYEKFKGINETNWRDYEI